MMGEMINRTPLKAGDIIFIESKEHETIAAKIESIFSKKESAIGSTKKVEIRCHCVVQEDGDGK